MITKAKAFTMNQASMILIVRSLINFGMMSPLNNKACQMTLTTIALTTIALTTIALTTIALTTIATIVDY